MARRNPATGRVLLLTAAVVCLGGATLVFRGDAGLDGADPLAAEPPVAEAAAVAPNPGASRAAADAEPADETRILVSLERRRLFLLRGADTLLSAPVAIGMGKDFEFEGRRYHFATPRGRRTVLAKQPDPIWTVPEWHYFEKAVKKGLGVVQLEEDSKVELSDGSFIVVVGDEVGRVNQRGYFAPFTPGVEIIFDGKIFVPPLPSKQRRVPDALGPFKLDMGDGYLIHGTHMYNEDSIGDAVSHGCVRMNNDDLERLYRMVPRGTPVIIF